MQTLTLPAIVSLIVVFQLAGTTPTHPGLTIREGLLTAEECALLIHLAAPLLVQSSTAGGSSDVRQSSSAWLPWINSTVHHTIQTKLEGLVGLSARHSELYQVSRYLPGQSYGLHVDDDPAGSTDGHSTSASIPALGRIATVLVYLNDVPVGGETVFTHNAADYDRGSGGSEQQIDRLAALCDRGLADENATRISPRLGTGVAWRTFTDSDPLVFLSNTSHCSCPVGDGGGSRLSGDGTQQNYSVWSSSHGAKFVLQKWFMVPAVAGGAPDTPLLDHPNALAHFPIGGAQHLLDVFGADTPDDECLESSAEPRCSSVRASDKSLLADFGRQDLGLAVSFVELSYCSRDASDGAQAGLLADLQRVMGPLPAVRGVRLRGDVALRVTIPRPQHQSATEDGVTAGVWVRAVDIFGDKAAPLLSVVAILNDVETLVEIRVQAADATHGRLALYWRGEPVNSNNKGAILVPLRKWLHVSLAVTPSAPVRGSSPRVSVTVHDIMMHTIALFDSGVGNESGDVIELAVDEGTSEETACDETDIIRCRSVLVMIGNHSGTIDLVELRVYRGGLSAGESRAMALAMHVLDPKGSRELES